MKILRFLYARVLLQLHMFPVHVQIETGMPKCRAPGRQKFPTVAPSIRSPQYGTCFVSPF